MIKKYTTLESFFTELECENIHYIVLRSYEELLSNKNYICEGHDIDILCAQSDLERFESIAGCLGFEEGTLYILVGERAVQLDVITTSSTEYPRELLEEALRSREYYKGVCHVPSVENAVCLLMFHCIKIGSIPDKYKKRIENNVEILNVKLNVNGLGEFKKYLGDRYEPSEIEGGELTFETTRISTFRSRD